MRLRAAEQLVADVALVDEDPAEITAQYFLIFSRESELLLVDGAVPQQELFERHPA
jgi:hypothetical protein